VAGATQASRRLDSGADIENVGKRLLEKRGKYPVNEDHERIDALKKSRVIPKRKRNERTRNLKIADSTLRVALG